MQSAENTHQNQLQHRAVHLVVVSRTPYQRLLAKVDESWQAYAGTACFAAGFAAAVLGWSTCAWCTRISITSDTVGWACTLNLMSCTVGTRGAGNIAPGVLIGTYLKQWYTCQSAQFRGSVDAIPHIQKSSPTCTGLIQPTSAARPARYAIHACTPPAHRPALAAWWPWRWMPRG